MAIYHLSIKIILRGKGKSAVAASAYRSGEKIKNEYDGIVHDFTKKGGIAYTEILLPQNAPQEFVNRSVLWNSVEKIEKSKNSQLAREIEIALPKELDREKQIELVREYVKENFVKVGMCADIALHDKNDGNSHCHILLHRYFHCRICKCNNVEHKNSRAEKLEEQVLAFIKEKYGEVKPEQKDRTSIKDLEKQIAKLEAKKTSDFEKYKLGKMTKLKFIESKKSIDKELESLSERVKELSKQDDVVKDNELTRELMDLSCQHICYTLRSIPIQLGLDS